MSQFNSGDVVLYTEEDRNTRTQKVRLVTLTDEPKWVSPGDTVWEFEAVEDGEMYAEGEVSFAREGELSQL